METNFLGNFLAERKIIGISLCEKERRLMGWQERKSRRCDEKFEERVFGRGSAGLRRGPLGTEEVSRSLGGS